MLAGGSRITSKEQHCGHPGLGGANWDMCVPRISTQRTGSRSVFVNSSHTVSSWLLMPSLRVLSGGVFSECLGLDELDSSLGSCALFILLFVVVWESVCGPC